ncbi:hypothetical protein Scep_016419 [Stephania cephalantha]|uniref:Uncharacterized protein n=1 Tax=Stephania cephalantha TaxID=152367 RepID=A0AAP0IMM9_9MAGN
MLPIGVHADRNDLDPGRTGLDRITDPTIKNRGSGPVHCPTSCSHTAPSSPHLVCVETVHPFPHLFRDAPPISSPTSRDLPHLVSDLLRPPHLVRDLLVRDTAHTPLIFKSSEPPATVTVGGGREIWKKNDIVRLLTHCFRYYGYYINYPS